MGVKVGWMRNHGTEQTARVGLGHFQLGISGTIHKLLPRKRSRSGIDPALPGTLATLSTR